MIVASPVQLFSEKASSITYCIYAVSCLLLAVSLSIPASVYRSRDARKAAMGRTGALLNCQASAPGAGSKILGMVNLFAGSFPHQPVSRGRFVLPERLR